MRRGIVLKTRTLRLPMPLTWNPSFCDRDGRIQHRAAGERNTLPVDRLGKLVFGSENNQKVGQSRRRRVFVIGRILYRVFGINGGVDDSVFFATTDCCSLRRIVTDGSDGPRRLLGPGWGLPDLASGAGGRADGSQPRPDHGGRMDPGVGRRDDRWGPLGGIYEHQAAAAGLGSAGVPGAVGNK